MGVSEKNKLTCTNHKLIVVGIAVPKISKVKHREVCKLVDTLYIVGDGYAT